MELKIKVTKDSRDIVMKKTINRITIGSTLIVDIAFFVTDKNKGTNCLRIESGLSDRFILETNLRTASRDPRET